MYVTRQLIGVDVSMSASGVVSPDDNLCHIILPRARGTVGNGCEIHLYVAIALMREDTRPAAPVGAVVELGSELTHV